MELQNEALQHDKASIHTIHPPFWLRQTTPRAYRLYNERAHNSECTANVRAEHTHTTSRHTRPPSGLKYLKDRKQGRTVNEVARLEQNLVDNAVLGSANDVLHTQPHARHETKRDQPGLMTG